MILMPCRALCVPAADETDVATMQRAKQAARDRLDTLCGWDDDDGGSDTAAEQVRWCGVLRVSAPVLAL